MSRRTGDRKTVAKLFVEARRVAEELERGTTLSALARKLGCSVSHLHLCREAREIELEFDGTDWSRTTVSGLRHMAGLCATYQKILLNAMLGGATDAELAELSQRYRGPRLRGRPPAA